MNLVGYTTTALSRNDIIDTPTNKNVVDGAIVELKDYDGNLVTIYDDINGTNPETQKTCDTNGQCTFFAEAGDYVLEVNGRPQNITISVNITVVNDVSSQRIWGDRYKGELTADVGVTLTDEFSVLLYDGNYYSYTGSDPFPVTVASGTVPTAPDYKLRNPTDHDSDINRNAVGAHDDIYVRSFNTVSDLIAGVDSAGNTVDFTKLIGLKVSTGAGTWKILNSSSERGITVNGGAKAIPLNGLWFNDFGADPNNINFSDDALSQAHSIAISLGGAKLRQGEGRYKFKLPFNMNGNGFHWKGSGQQSTWNDYYGTGTFISGNGFRCSIKSMRIQDQGKQADTCIDEAYMKECQFEDLEITTPFDDETGWLVVAINAVGTPTDGNFTNDYQRVRVVGASGWGMILGQNSNAVTSHKLSFARCGLGDLRIDRANGINLDVQSEGSESGKGVYIGNGAQVNGLKLDLYSELTPNVSASRAFLVEGTAEVEGLHLNLNYVWGAVSDGYLGPNYGAEINTSGGGFCFGTINVGLVHGVQVAAVAANNSSDRVRVSGVRALTGFSTGTSLPILDNKTSGASTSESVVIEGLELNQSILLPKFAVQPNRIKTGSIWFSENAVCGFLSVDGSGRLRLSLERNGSTANRPTTGIQAGTYYFDTTLGKPIWYSGSGGIWVDATGSSV